ncbi:MAG: hypothetical protein QQN63_06975 [Nitrosopumilus sp.]
MTKGSDKPWWKKTPKEVLDFLDKNKGGKVEATYDSSVGQWKYIFQKKGEFKMGSYDVKCIECEKQGATLNSIHCYECVHCTSHCKECLCCCNTSGHCKVCTWHIDGADCDPYKCSCCCNYHCISCGHDSQEICKENSQDKCTCCGCYVTKKLKTKQANKTNNEWLKILSGYHSNKINPKHLGPKDILKDIGLFYILMAHDDKKLYDDHKTLLAQRLLTYLMVSCAGEARHTLTKTHGDITTLGEMAQTILVASNINGDLSNRQYMWSAIYDLSKVSGEGVIMEALEELFNLEWVTSSYGGPKWAKIAQLAKNYCKGEYTEAIFIDGIMNVVHNGGWAFNKYYKSSAGGSYYNDGITMMQLLDYKKEANLKSIYALLVPMGVTQNNHTNTVLYKKAMEIGVVDETGQLTAKYGVNFDKAKVKTKPYYPMQSKVEVPSVAYIQYLKQQEALIVA